MPPKSTRVRKAPNREPISAVTSRTAPTVPIPSSPDQLATLLDPQLFVHDMTITVASGLNDSSQYDDFDRPQSASSSLDFSTLLGAHLIDCPQPILTQSSEFEPFEPVIPDDLEQPIQIEKYTEKLARKFGWSLLMENVLFQELLHQEEIGKCDGSRGTGNSIRRYEDSKVYSTINCLNEENKLRREEEKRRA